MSSVGAAIATAADHSALISLACRWQSISILRKRFAMNWANALVSQRTRSWCGSHIDDAKPSTRVAPKSKQTNVRPHNMEASIMCCVSHPSECAPWLHAGPQETARPLVSHPAPSPVPHPVSEPNSPDDTDSDDETEDEGGGGTLVSSHQIGSIGVFLEATRSASSVFNISG